jgi:hypothetical protein
LHLLINTYKSVSIYVYTCVCVCTHFFGTSFNLLALNITYMIMISKFI